MLDKILLFPYYIILKVRHSLYDANSLLRWETSPVPTICVGNVTVGGTGKTPHVELIIRTIKEDPDWKDKHIAVLSRGYKRRTKGFLRVNDKCRASEVGDEPLQIARKFPDVTVAVDKDRVRACRLLSEGSEDFPKADVIILDDAFQYRKLKAGMNVVLVDYRRPVFSDKLIPLGSLRDLPERIYKADVLIVTKCPDYMEDEEKMAWAKKLRLSSYDTQTCKGVSRAGISQRLFFTSVSYCPAEPIFEECDPRYVYAKRAVLFTGIAHDEPLRRYLTDAYKVVKRYSYPDHHAFTKGNIATLKRATKIFPTAALITTEKDAQRVLDCKKMPFQMKERLFKVPIKSYFPSEREEGLFRQSISLFLSWLQDCRQI